MFTDPISDLLTRIRNANSVGHPTVSVPASKAKRQVLQVLLEEGYISNFEALELEHGKKNFKVYLKFEDGGEPVIQTLDRISKPGRRVYVGRNDIPRHKGGLGLVVVSTSKGMLSDREARRQGIGGELVCSVF